MKMCTTMCAIIVVLQKQGAFMTCSLAKVEDSTKNPAFMLYL